MSLNKESMSMDNVGGVNREGNGHDEFVLRRPKVVKV